jgi:hypothetical protein
MIAKARDDHPHPRFELADGHEFSLHEPLKCGLLQRCAALDELRSLH